MLPKILAAVAALATFSRVADAAQAQTCVLHVPDNPLTADGLATPYEVEGCDQTDPAQASFVQGAVYDPNNGDLFVYNPLIVNKGTKPAIAPVKPKIPKGAIVGLWFGTNSAALKLKGNNLDQSNCVNGLGDSIFGQFAACNAVKFFDHAQNVNVPAPLKAVDHRHCPTTRDFFIVDQDQSDNVVTTYLLTNDKKLAQDTPENRKALGKVTTLTNGSDNRLLTVIQAAIGCKVFMVPDLASKSGQQLNALPLNELQASLYEKDPIATVPLRDPMTLVNGQISIDKNNLYRQQVFQPPFDDGSHTEKYCQHMLDVAPPRLRVFKNIFLKKTSPDPAMANNLYTFLLRRFNNTFSPAGLDCNNLLGIHNPVTLVMKKNVVVDAFFNI